MKKLLPCLLLVCLCLTGCATLSLPLEKETATLVPGTNPTLPEAQPCLLYTSPSPRDDWLSRMPSSA